MKISIVIGTCGLEHGLGRCLESIFDNTNMDHNEVIVVANGADEETKKFLLDSKPRVKSLWYDERLGYPKAYNAGIQASSGEIVILLNDDTVVLDRSWIGDLLEPFDDLDVGITGPMKFSWRCLQTTRYAMAFWCVAIQRSVFESIGYLDEAFSPGMGEDMDFSIRAQWDGWKLVQVPMDGHDEFGQKTSNKHFMMFHKGNGTFAEDVPGKEAAIAKNKIILEERYGKGASGRGYSGI